MTVETNQAIADEILTFVRARTQSELTADVDLFGTGLVSSLFAMELLVHLEQSFGIAVEGPELRLDNFRTVEAMATLVRRLQGAGR